MGWLVAPPAYDYLTCLSLLHTHHRCWGSEESLRRVAELTGKGSELTFCKVCVCAT